MGHCCESIKDNAALPMHFYARRRAPKTVKRETHKTGPWWKFYLSFSPTASRISLSLLLTGKTREINVESSGVYIKCHHPAKERERRLTQKTTFFSSLSRPNVGSVCVYGIVRRSGAGFRTKTRASKEH